MTARWSLIEELAEAVGSLRIGGRGWAYVGTWLGIAASEAGNVLDTYARAAEAHRAVSGPAVGGAMFWPVALFVTLEILGKTPWPELDRNRPRWWSIPSGLGTTALRYLGTTPVAGVAAVVSYRHLSNLLHSWGEDAVTVAIGPLAVDGLLVVAAAALLATRPRPVPAGDDDPQWTRLVLDLQAGRLAPGPRGITGEAIRQHLGIRGTKAREYRDRLRELRIPLPGPLDPAADEWGRMLNGTERVE